MIEKGNQPTGMYDDPIDVVEVDPSDSTIKTPPRTLFDAMDADLSDGSEMDYHNESEELPPARATQNVKPPVKLPFPAGNEHSILAKRLMKPIPDYPVQDESHHTWTITDWKAIRREDKVRGPMFECAGLKWNVLLLPRSSSDAISLYMEPHAPPEIEGESKTSWHVCAQFVLDIWNPDHPESHYPCASQHRFTRAETDWGFSSFITGRDLSMPAKVDKPHAILENNKLNITGYVRVIDDSSTGVLWHNFVDYDSKANTGYVGLNNQGATCYLNSLLQSYYTTRVFRDLVCQIPTDTTVASTLKSSKAVPLALQRIFYLLQLSSDPVGTMELTKSFGWDSSDAFTQHDVQELNRVLMDRLESAMKGTKIEKKLNGIFVGKMKSYIKCVDVPYESSREEEFWDIQLNVKGFTNLEQSFANYIEIEMLDGENKYQAGDKYGYQDAKKGVVFQEFPPVLHLQLKRFEYDFMVDDLVKIDDFYEFPDRIDVRPYLDEDLPSQIKDQNWNYKLHGVLVHQGSISNGHYYAMIKPEANEEGWLRFDDDKVWKATPTQVFQENFGASEIPTSQLRLLTRAEQNDYMIRRATTAYMLVYYRELLLPSILPKQLAPVPEHVSKQIQAELEETNRREKLKRELLFYMDVRIVTVKNFCYFNGFDIFPDPTKPKLYSEDVFDKRAYTELLRVKKDSTLAELYDRVAEIVGLGALGDKENSPSHRFRFIPIKSRNNKTNRPGVPFTEDLYSLTVNQVYTKCFKRKFEEFAVFVEDPRLDLAALSSSASTKSPEAFDFDALASRILSNTTLVPLEDSFESHPRLFVKYFDPVTDEVRGITYYTTSKNTVVAELMAPINKALQFSSETKLDFFEEVSHIQLHPIDPSLTVEKNELTSGDILVVQLAEVESATFERKFRNAAEYYNFLLTRLHIEVRPFKADADEEDSDFVADDGAGAKDEKAGTPLDGKSQESQEIELAKELSQSIDFWISSNYTHDQLAREIATKIGGNVDPEYLKLFIVNNHGTRIPLSSKMSLSQIFSRQVAVSSLTVFEYEILNITLKEYENMRSLKIFWLNKILLVQSLELLIPKTSSFGDAVKKLLVKLSIPKEQWSGVLAWASGSDHRYEDLLKFDTPIGDFDDHYEIYCGYFPAEVEILSCHDMTKKLVDEELRAEQIEDELVRLEFIKAQQHSKLLNIIPVFHFHKTITYAHSRPFIFAVFPDEPFLETKARLQHKLGLGALAFAKMRIAVADSEDKGRYLDADKPNLVLLDELARFDSLVLLALDHPDRSPRKTNPFDKGISIN